MYSNSSPIRRRANSHRRNTSGTSAARNLPNAQLQRLNQSISALNQVIRDLQREVRELKNNQQASRNTQGSSVNPRGCQQAQHHAGHHAIHGHESDFDMIDSDSERALAEVEAVQAAEAAMPAPRGNNVLALQAAATAATAPPPPPPPQQQQQQPGAVDNSNNSAQLSLVMMDAITELYKRVSSIEVPIEFLYSSLLPLYDASRATGDGLLMYQRWERFQEQGKLEFGYCFHAVIYLGHKSERAERGDCWCRPKLNTLSVGAPYNRSTKCIRVRRDGRKEGRLCFWWERNVGSCPDLSRLEYRSE